MNVIKLNSRGMGQVLVEVGEAHKKWRARGGVIDFDSQLLMVQDAYFLSLTMECAIPFWAE